MLLSSGPSKVCFLFGVQFLCQIIEVRFFAEKLKLRFFLKKMDSNFFLKLVPATCRKEIVICKAALVAGVLGTERNAVFNGLLFV